MMGSHKIIKPKKPVYDWLFNNLLNKAISKVEQPYC